LALKHTEIQDPFGPTITDEQISALIISAETRSGGNAVNEKREARGWSALEVFEVDVLDGASEGDSSNNGVKTDFDNKLSSSAIREKLARKSQGKI
jgi:phosphopantetheine adenylyltransferase